MATKSDKSSVTFDVHDVEIPNDPLEQLPQHKFIEKILGTRIESCSDYHTQVCNRGMGYQPLLAAVYTAYSLHRPLVLSPDAVWLTIAQGVAHHMALEGERLRNRFVTHSDRLDLVFRSSGWVASSPENPWCEAFESWTNQISEHVGSQLHETLICNFSTTTPASYVASQIVMMDIFEKYFRYIMVAICGIPHVTLRGSSEDWERLAEKVEMLEPFDMPWWLEHLRPIVQQFVKASKGEIDLNHWKNICKLEDAYGGDFINGWVAKLFPYLRAYVSGPCTEINPIFTTGEGFQTFLAPSGLSQVPFEWIDMPSGTKRSMEAIGGLVGVVQDKETLALEPIAGWAIREGQGADKFINEVKDHFEITLHPPVERKLDSTQKTNNLRVLPSGLKLPFDIERFYYEFKEARLKLSSDNNFLEIISVDKIETVDWGEEQDSSQDVKGRTWYRFADLPDDQHLAINLDQYLKLILEDETLRELWSEDLFSPICIYDNETQGHAGRNPIIAKSFGDLIKRLMESKKDQYPLYWLSSEFEPFGDANDFTRLESIDKLIELKNIERRKLRKKRRNI